MNTNKVLTIVIPTYNMESYLATCLNSLCITSGFEYLEVLIVNDGSRDRSLKIAQGYEDRYPGVFRVIDKENGNYGSCVNRGLSEAKGKYIKILDADDRFDTSAFEEYVLFLTSVDVDLVITDFVMVTSTGNIKQKISYNIPQNHEIAFAEIPDDIPLWMHSVTYKTDNLRAINYYQTEGISYTDQEWIYLPMTTVNKIYYKPIIIYKYLIGREGQSVDPKVFVKSIKHEEIGLKIMLEGFGGVPVSSVHRKYLLGRILARINVIYSAYLYRYPEMLSLGDLISLDQYVRKYQDVYNASNNISIHRRVSYHYIQQWRKNNRLVPDFYKILISFVVIIGRVKKYICKIL